ncbi:hypothetical protein AAFF_G00172110 [Aldrovandia affinis]|uniref:Uncharacterized protein n=1 Tax=Aldrovandia affinis TaxID=143900 RepID=A0AAD7SYW7_9TELE|nr:hypothetical protein AAFF_G00172110 [Aldrovandia affinis]
MRSLFPVTVCCISLLSLQQQLLALPTESRLERNRLAFHKRLQELSEGEDFGTGTVASSADSSDFALEAKWEWWKSRLSRKPPPRQGARSPCRATSPRTRTMPWRSRRGGRGGDATPTTGQGVTTNPT